MRLGLRGRAIGLCVLLVVGTGGAISAALIWQSYKDSERAIAEHTISSARSLAQLAEAAVLLNDREALDRIVRSALGNEDLLLVQVTGISGIVLAGAQRDEEVTPSIDPARLLRSHRVADPQHVHFDRGDNRLTVIAPIWYASPKLDLEVIDEEPAGSEVTNLPLGNVVVVHGLARLEQESSRRAMASAALAGVFLLAGFSVTVVVIRRLLRPVRSLVDATARIADGDLGVRASEDASSEIGVLARSFNHMADRLQKLYASIESQVRDRTEELVSERAKLQESEGRLRRQNITLSELTATDLIYTGTLEAAVGAITEAAARTLDVGRASVWLLTDDREALRCIDLYVASEDRHVRDSVLRVAEHRAYIEAMDEGRAIAAHEARTDARTASFVSDYLVPLDIWSMLDAPVRLGGEVVGVVCFEHLEAPRRWAPEEEHFAGSLADLVVLALQAADRKRALDRLRESEEGHRQIFESATDAMLIINIHGDIVEANPAACALYGRAYDDLAGKPYRDVVHPDSHTFCDELMEALRCGGCLHAQPYNLRAPGATFQAEVLGNRVDFHGKPHFLAVSRDITQAKLAAERLEQAKEAAEQANLAKSEFLANMSHEIRTPMTAITGFADLVFEEIGSLPSSHSEEAPAVQDRCREHVEIIRRNGYHLLDIINDILDLSKVEAGKLEIERSRTSPRQIIDEVLGLMQVRMAEKSIASVVEYDSSLPETIETDGTRVRQILINMIGNAVKFTSSGSITVRVRLIDAETKNAKLQIDVADTGIGIGPDQIDRLFMPFSQADSSTTRRFGGSGLGLAVSKRLAQMLGGDVVVVSSAPGEGSTFRLTVGAGQWEPPTRSSSDVAESEVDKSPMPPSGQEELSGDEGLAGVRVLLVEDGPDNQRLIAFILKKAGAEVVVAENGQVGLDVALSNDHLPFDLVLMDMQMPVMDGYSATARLREAGYTAPIIALTAHAMAGDRAKCLAAGCDDYATKPVQRAELLACVASHIRRSVPAQPPTNSR